MIHYAPLNIRGLKGVNNVLQDEKLEYIQEQFREKDEVLAEYGERVTARQMYEDIFGNLDVVLPVVFIDDEGQESELKHIVPMSIEEALGQSEGRDNLLVGGCTYFNNWISKKTAKDIYTFIIDMDNVYSGTLLNALKRDWATASGELLPMPTYIVNSGTGLHLYFVLDNPLPNYKRNTENIDKVYRALAIQQTTKRVYLRRQVQWFGQDFRMAGGLNKYQWVNSVYRMGHKWNINQLAAAVGVVDVEFIGTGERNKITKKTKRLKSMERREGWRSNPAFYEYAVKTCEAKTREGNRYMSMCALSVIAWKCNVPIERLEKDLKGLLPEYNKGAKRIIKEKEIYSAMKMYNPKAMLTQRARLEDWQGWEYKPIKRNGRKRAEHIRLMNFIRDEISGKRDTWREGNGRKTKEETVYIWRADNPNGTKADCIRETGLSKPTVYKWWDWKPYEEFSREEALAMGAFHEDALTLEDILSDEMYSAVMKREAVKE